MRPPQPELGGRPVYSGRVFLVGALILDVLLVVGSLVTAVTWAVTGSVELRDVILMFGVAALGIILLLVTVAFVRRRGFPIAYVIPHDHDDES